MVQKSNSCNIKETHEVCKFIRLNMVNVFENVKMDNLVK